MLKRTPVRKKRAGPPRRGRVIDKNFLAFMGKQVCLVSRRSGVTLHHVRRYGEQKNDRRIIPLVAEFHLYESGRYSIERLGKARFENHHRVNIEAAIIEYNRAYQLETNEALSDDAPSRRETEP